MSQLTVGDLTFDVRRSTRRKSVEITVDRGGELRLSAPDDCSERVMVDFVRQKRMWIYTKLAQKEALAQIEPARQLVNGEGFPYLGRSYRLQLVDEQETPVKLEQGRFKLRRRDVEKGREHLIGWYTERGSTWLAKRVERYRARVGVEVGGVTAVTAQDLGYRWGSCGKGGRLFFHWRTVLLPPRVIDYVVVHELVHLVEPHHTPGFWTRVERVMPDYAERKAWLAERGGGVGWV